MTMAEKLTTALLMQAYRAAAKNAKMAHRISGAMEARYGCTHSDADCDNLIEALDYGSGAAPTLSYADEQMARCGFPVKKDTPDDQS
jgi:hypothetical protein